MCEICRSYPCNCHCPNYEPSKAYFYCSICGKGIYEGEEYIINDNFEYAHWDCVDYGRDLGIRDIYYTTNDGYAYEKLEKNKVGGVA